MKYPIKTFFVKKKKDLQRVVDCREMLDVIGGRYNINVYIKDEYGKTCSVGEVCVNSNEIVLNDVELTLREFKRAYNSKLLEFVIIYDVPTVH
jgi:hypothetical protein